MDIQKIAAQYGISSEEVRSRWLALRVAIWKSDFRKFCRDVVRIRAKDGTLAPLIFNEAQEILHTSVETMLKETRWVRITGLKGRRQGYSTYTAARGYWRAILWDRQHIYILSHEMQSSNVLFDMVALMQEQNPFPPAVGTDNAKELEFIKRGSRYTVATAGQKAGGRGGAVSYFHGSEVSRWVSAEDHFSSSVQGVDEVRGVWGTLWQEPVNPLPFERGKGTIEGWVKAPSEVILETTSAGPTGAFYHRYMDAMKGIGDYRHVFVPWYVQKEYTREGEFIASHETDDDFGMSEAEYQANYNLTDGQMLWRRGKLHELGSAGLMFQEYPSDIMEGFSGADTEASFIKPALILKARKRQMTDPDAPLIVGVDPAGAGGDRFAIAFRRGDKIIDVRHRNKLEHDEAVAWLSAIIDEEKPSFMVIDKGSMGGNILSSLRNISPDYANILRGVDFGGKSRIKLANPNRAGPWNRRAELYGKFRDWMTEGGSIPDDDDLASDISAPHIKYRANNDWLLESKSDMKSRGIRSTDLSDACVMTFAVTEWVESWSPPRQRTGFQAGVDRQMVSINNTSNTNPHAWMM